jgi:uncharacterized protein YjbI with pentapeptide repeats
MSSILVRKCDRETTRLFTNFQSADLGGTYLNGVNLRGYNVEGTSFPGACLHSADFSLAKAKNTNFSGANLRESVFIGTDLRCANFSRADLACADFSYADLRGAYFLYANLSNADFEEAKLNWNSSDIISELLYREADHVKKQFLAGAIKMSYDTHWSEFLLKTKALKKERKWAIAVLKKYTKPHDNSPLFLRVGS